MGANDRFGKRTILSTDCNVEKPRRTTNRAFHFHDESVLQSLEFQQRIILHPDEVAVTRPPELPMKLSYSVAGHRGLYVGELRGDLPARQFQLVLGAFADLVAREFFGDVLEQVDS